jgi:hypothetical protein
LGLYTAPKYKAEMGVIEFENWIEEASSALDKMINICVPQPLP